MYHYETKGTCSSAIDIELDGDIVRRVAFTDGCSGNTRGVERLVEGRNVDEVIDLLKDITCDGGPSCPAQLAQALTELKTQGDH